MASSVVLVITIVLYYASRFRNMVSMSTLIANVVGLSLFTVNYFLNSGLRGPTDLFFLLFLLLSIAISPAEQYKVWIPVNVMILIILNMVEFYYPGYVPDTYLTRSNRFVDHMSAYAVVAAITYFCIHYIRGSYEKEKASAVEKTKAIELQNRQIVKQNEELEKLNAEKNKLMSIVAHDLRSPLASIQNFLELLTQHELEEEQKLDIENNLLNSTKDTLAMLSKLLDWSKSQLHGVSVHMEQLNVQTLFEATLNLERHTAASKDITLDYYFDPSASIYADSDMMQLILRNIVGNAIKFTPNGGRIMVRAEAQGSNCLITVQDDGIGMSAEKQESIFSLHVESTFGTNNEKGVGLGLMLCTEFIKAQNGRIWLDSTPGRGTCFFIAVPMFDQNKTRQSDLKIS